MVIEITLHDPAQPRPVGNRTLLQDYLGGTTTSVYDAANRLTSRQFGGTGQTPLRIDIGYTVRNQVSSETRYSDLAGLNKVGSSAFTYDNAARLTNLQHKNATDVVLENFTYVYDLANRLTSKVENGTTTTFGYDTTNQLTNDGATGLSYDLNGNRTLTGYQTGTNNQLISDGTWSYLYDNEGNRTKKTKGTNAETWTFGYDNWNHLVWAKDSATDGGTVLSLTTFLYDVFGNRIEKDAWNSTSGTTTVQRFAYDLASREGDLPEVWADLDANSSLTTRYLRGDLVDELFARTSFAGIAAWFLPDYLGSIRDITDNTGSVIDHIDFNAFGNITNETQPANGDRFKFTGREWDKEINLQYNRARYYDPATGRWISEDPIGFGAGDPNLNRYVGNGPTNFTDAGGMLFPNAVWLALQKKDPEVYRFLKRFHGEIKTRDTNLFQSDFLCEQEHFSFGTQTVWTFDNDVGADKAVDYIIGQIRNGPYKRQFGYEILGVPRPPETISPRPGSKEYDLWMIKLEGERRDLERKAGTPEWYIWFKAFWMPGGGFDMAMDVAAPKGMARAARTSGRPGRPTNPSTLVPGPYAGRSIPARGPGRRFTDAERQQINEIGRRTGCHTCGKKQPGTDKGNFIPDHQPPNALNPKGCPQRLYPQCLECSQRQGGEVTAGKVKE